MSRLLVGQAEQRDARGQQHCLSVQLRGGDGVVGVTDDALGARQPRLQRLQDVAEVPSGKHIDADELIAAESGRGQLDRISDSVHDRADARLRGGGVDEADDLVAVLTAADREHRVPERTGDGKLRRSTGGDVCSAGIEDAR